MTSPEFLSDAWIDALAASLAAGSGSSPNPLTIQYVVATDAGEVIYHVALGPDGDTASAGPSEAASVTFRMDKATAEAISAGRLSSEEAFITGRLDLEGDAAALIDTHRASGDA